MEDRVGQDPRLESCLGNPGHHHSSFPALILGDVLLQRVGKAGAAAFGLGRGCSVISPTSDFGQELRSPTLMETSVPRQGGPALQATSVHWAQGCPSPALWAPSQTSECHSPQAQEVSPSCLAPCPAAHPDRFTSSLSWGNMSFLEQKLYLACEGTSL